MVHPEADLPAMPMVKKNKEGDGNLILSVRNEILIYSDLMFLRTLALKFVDC